MPIFFNEKSLDSLQTSRYESCMEEYWRIQYNNAEQEKDYLRSIGKLTSNIAASIDNRAKSYQPSNKSALFWRLLQGKSALSIIPPTSFSYPWYEIIEEDGPFEVIVHWNKFQQHLLGIPFLPVKKDKILINHALWNIIYLNQAASRLLDLDYSSSQTDIKEVFDLKPYLIVSFNDKTQYRLHLGRKTIYGRRHSILQEKYSLDFGGGNPNIIEIIQEQEDYVQENYSQRIEFIKNQYLANNFLQKQFLASHDNTDNQFDWLKVEVDGWNLEKIQD